MWAIGEGQSDDWKIVDDYSIELKKLSNNFEVAVPGTIGNESGILITTQKKQQQYINFLTTQLVIEIFSE
ncbi:hypothetical protein J2786_003642 [Chryseobacterium vietnamense]|uniref:Uncharacterized protein n=1 Tax=Chryseobacterium vietnamense TaxID=866785 RepID=A0ACC6JCK1_9FLAO|nr:hypothetical protein [Chryseobacterium vietnamense]MDR6460508.1 hypothetical protein [Chryseobacterium vietnamense]